MKTCSVCEKQFSPKKKESFCCSVRCGKISSRQKWEVSAKVKHPISEFKSGIHRNRMLDTRNVFC